MAADAAAGEPEAERDPLVSGQIMEYDEVGLPIYYWPEAKGKGAGRGRGQLAGTRAGRGRGRALVAGSTSPTPAAPAEQERDPDGDCRDSCLLGVVLLLGWVLRVRGERMRRRDEGER